MKTYDLAVLIPSRNEEFASITVENILKNKRGNTQVLIGLDGNWPDPAIEDHPDLTILYVPESIGQRAITNRLCELANAKWVMKIDSHCLVDEGFDVKLLKDAKDNQTIVPALYNLHGFDWVCNKCGNTWYQGAKPEYCFLPGEKRIKNDKCDSKSFSRKIILKPRLSRRSEFYRFDTEPHFQYHGQRKKDKNAQGMIAETMSIQGSCFMLTKKKYKELNVCDENLGSWGSQGIEVACKTWLSGGQVVTNKNTWYSHLFRTQQGFGFPYPISGNQTESAKKKVRDLFYNNKWEKQIYPLSWLIEKFKPLPDWHDEKGKEVLDYVNKKGQEFYKDKIIETITKESNGKPTKNCIYYTDNKLNLKIAHACRKQIKKANIPIISASLKPLDNMGTNIHVKLQRGYRAYFTQILMALEESKADIVYLTEHDWLYHPTHFDFTPDRYDTFYYNLNWWRVRASDGHAVHYDTQLVPGLVAYRKLLLEYYNKQYEYLKQFNFEGKEVLKAGFEPGTHNRIKELSGYRVNYFKSAYPLIDIRHDSNLTRSKWSIADFRNPSKAKNWIEKDASEIDGWKFKKGDFLGSLKYI